MKPRKEAGDCWRQLAANAVKSKRREGKKKEEVCGSAR